MTPEQVLHFWFDELEPKNWFEKSDQLDQTIQSRFGDAHNQATKGEFFTWREAALGRLAEIILLDQFSRNMFREDAKSFAYDGMALILAQEAIAVEADQELSPIQRSFLYMPFMHSESALIHEKAVELFSKNGLEGNLDYEFKHKAIIDRFGRYPHRNSVLKRESTPEEIEFLKGPDSSF